MSGKRPTKKQDKPPRPSPQSDRLPRGLRAFFWDYQPARLSWKKDRDLIVSRILAVGDWKSIQWVRSRLGDEALRDWLLKRRGAGLGPRQLRFWELLLDLPHRQVDAWLANTARQAWDQRCP
jgi:hypothetical protein